MATQHDISVYHPWEMEDRWRRRWADEGTYRTPELAEGRRTYYCLDFFPYPSGEGLSVQFTNAALMPEKSVVFPAHSASCCSFRAMGRSPFQ